MKRYVCTSLGFPVFYDDQQGLDLPVGAKKITEKQFQEYVRTQDPSPFIKGK